MAKVDTGNEGVPYESPSNKCYKMDGCCLEDGSEVNLTFEQANIIAGYGTGNGLHLGVRRYIRNCGVDSAQGGQLSLLEIKALWLIQPINI